MSEIVNVRRSNSLGRILPLTPTQFLTGELPVLPLRETRKLSRPQEAPRSPFVVYSPTEDLIARRGIWNHFSKTANGIERKAKKKGQALHPRVIPHTISGLLYKIDDFISTSYEEMATINALLNPEAKIADLSNALLSLSRFILMRELTESGSWRHHPPRGYLENQAIEEFADLCQESEDGLPGKATVAINALRDRSWGWRQQLGVAMYHPAVHDLILSVRESRPDMVSDGDWPKATQEREMVLNEAA